MNTYIQVVTTVDDRKTAEKIGEAVINQRLAACVQITSCSSIYRWQGNIEKSEEFLCILKSSRSLYPELEQAIKDSHPYGVPEILATDIVAGEPHYLAWLEQELKPVAQRD